MRKAPVHPTCGGGRGDISVKTASLHQLALEASWWSLSALEPIAKRKSDGTNKRAIVCLTFDGPLPSMKELTSAVEEQWLAMIQAAICKGRRENQLPYFEKAFVWIEVVSPRGTNHAKVWDTTNRAVNVIINNLKGGAMTTI